jgi:hypothetical protein
VFTVTQDGDDEDNVPDIDELGIEDDEADEVGGCRQIVCDD